MKTVINKVKRNTWLAVAVVLGVTSCQQNDEAARLPDGKHPIIFTAAVNEPTVTNAATRATTDNTWTGGEEVAIQMDGEVKKYTAAVGGVLSSTTPFYWQSTSDINVTAWYQHTYSAAKPTSFTVQTDQSGAGYQQSDLLYSVSQAVTFKNANLTFKHLPVKVVVNLKNGDGVTADEVTNATVTIENQATTSGTIATDWSVTQTSGNASITPKTLTSTASDAQKSVQALVVPQQMQGKKFIKVTCRGTDYFYTPMNADDANLQVGNQYIYTITVKKNGITVTASGATEWTTGSTTDITSKELFLYTASDLKVGDYYYSDGTWSDGGLRKMTADGEFFVMTEVAPDLTGGRSVIGIVFKTGKDNSGDCIDDCDYKQKDGVTAMNTIQGYVIALYDANTSSSWCSWELYKKGNGGIGNGISWSLQGFYGYKFTNIIQTVLTGRDMETDFPATYLVTAGYEKNHQAPDKTSGWFFPSAGQGQYWINHAAIYLPNIRKATGDSSYEWKAYWSSSECDNYLYHARTIAIGAGFGSGSLGWDSKYLGYATRSLLAF